jgi:hypothetical protein
MDFGKSFTYPFEDKEWVTKLLIGSLLSLIPFVNIATYGYALRIVKNVADGVEQPLPNWDDMGDYFMKGLIATLGTLVYFLPVIALAVLIAVFSALAGYDPNTNSAQFAPFVVCVWGLSCITGLYSLFAALILPAAYAKYAISGEFGAFFRFREILSFITSNLGDYIIVLILACVAYFVASFGVILCCIGIVFTEFWALLVGPHLLGQICRMRATPTSPMPIVETPLPTPEPTV